MNCTYFGSVEDQIVHGGRCGIELTKAKLFMLLRQGPRDPTDTSSPGRQDAGMVQSITCAENRDVKSMQNPL
jgi:hypothetical protein